MTAEYNNIQLITWCNLAISKLRENLCFLFEDNCHWHPNCITYFKRFCIKQKLHSFPTRKRSMSVKLFFKAKPRWQHQQTEPLMTKPTKWHVRPAKTQISLGICPGWSESLLCTQRVAKDPTFLHADSEDSDLTGWMPRLIWVFSGRTVILLVLSCGGSLLIGKVDKKQWSGIYTIEFHNLPKTPNKKGKQKLKWPWIYRGYSNFCHDYDFYSIEWSERIYISWVARPWIKYLFFSLHEIK